MLELLSSFKPKNPAILSLVACLHACSLASPDAEIEDKRSSSQPALLAPPDRVGCRVGPELGISSGYHWPLSGIITAGYGGSSPSALFSSTRRIPGVTLQVAMGAEVRAGVQATLRPQPQTPNPALGTSVELEVGDELVVTYGHLASKASTLVEGQSLAADAIVGSAGCSGNTTCGAGSAVLYVETKRNGSPVDPLTLFPDPGEHCARD